ncbi:hypothetical protein BJ322DRAFT_683086 [Thelephora terrestris]|uniref:Uncharacterized protein n=1 Tax=Thelephora terrestris TaxID=56493 RepID=A0A9P6L8L3_9AGAM|nr:hypothetical protein BJ322DRAFT_683086 [Thelephora terrestris]
MTMALRQVEMDSKPIKIYEATPRAVASNVVFLVAWLAGTTGYFLSILATTLAQCIRWLPFGTDDNPFSFAYVNERNFNRPPRPKPDITRPLIIRENVERHVSFSHDSRTGRNMQQPLPPGDNMTCTTASFSSGNSTLSSSPLSVLGDLPPLKNLPPLLLDPQILEMPERIQVKRPTTANFALKARNPFKFRRTSTSSSPIPIIGEIPSVCPLIDRVATSPTEQGSKKPSLIKRLNMKGRRACSVGMMTKPPSSAPTSPRPSPSSFRNPANASKRSASVDIPSQILNSPAFVLPSLQQGSPRRSLFSSFTKRSRAVSLSAAPARTQPYGPPYNCPFPIPQPRRSSGTRPPTTTSTQTPNTHNSARVTHQRSPSQ